jgi:hypothetical protein
MPIFRIKVSGEKYEIKALDLESDHTRFEVSGPGDVKFTLQHQINASGNETLAIVDAQSVINQDQVDKIADKISSYYE